LAADPSVMMPAIFYGPSVNQSMHASESPLAADGANA
jgi:hypothetical protein